MAYNPNWSAGGGGGSANWGGIGGDINTQTDLQTQLATKADASIVGRRLFVQSTTPTFNAGEKALYIQQSGSDLTFWVEDGT